MTSIDPVRSFVATQTALLAPTMHEAMSSAIHGARTRMHGLDLTKYPTQFSGLVRAELREDLETRSLLDGWTVGGDPRQMAQLTLVNDENALVFRFLKENRSNAGGVPHAGPSRARQRAWNQLHLPFDPDPAVEPSSRASGQPATFLLLWALKNAHDPELGFTLRLVHTIDSGTHRHGATCDMEIELRPGGSIFDHLAFRGSDESGDLFTIEIAEENDGG